ncbi:hypothetical protein AAF712_016845, partial [Marasmius tenuissimus]
MANTPTVQEREVLVKRNSKSWAQRIRRTHVSGVVINWFKKLPAADKFRVNFEIRKKNSERKERDMQFIQSLRDKQASPQASEWSINSADCAELANSKQQLEKAKPYLKEQLATLLEEQQRIAELKSGKKEMSVWEKELLYAPKMVEVEPTADREVEIHIHPILRATVNYNPKETP